MSEVLAKAIKAVRSNKYSFCKFVSANDAGETGAHQAGLYIPKNSIALMFDQPGQKGENMEKFAEIKWHDGMVSKCRFIYYGQGTRNEYRITRLGKSFELGQLVVIVKESEETYLGFALPASRESQLFLSEFELTIEDTNSLIPVEGNSSEMENSDYNFKPRARIIKVIGEELISNDVIALVELIKNSYDADALNIEIELNNIFSSAGEIIIKDDGLGMSHEKIVNVWLEPATPDKKSGHEKKYSLCFLRRLLGEKGIGRFAAHRLGNNIELITRARLECATEPLNYETKVKVDWNSFTEDKYLHEIPITVQKNFTPTIFRSAAGTLIKISNIRPWKNAKAVKDAVVKIKGLESPVKAKKLLHHKQIGSSDPGISINIISDDIKLNTELSALKSLTDVIDSAFYKFSAIVDDHGQILYDYNFNRVDCQDIKREVKGGETSLLSYDVNWFESRPLQPSNSPGTFEVSFYAWDLDSAVLKVAGLADYYRNIIKPNTGVRIYRDNFRVWPYGEPDNDWLELDLTRLNAPKERGVSRNQIFGIVHISSTQNGKLVDQSNREGLITNEQYEQFYHLVNATLTLFAKERKADKIRIDKVAKSKKVNDVVSESIDLLRSKIESNQHNPLYKNSVDQLEEAYQGKINDVLERYMMAAAIGISYTMPIHEMKLRLTSIKHVIEDIERNASLEDKYLRELFKQLNDTEDIIRAVSSIMSRQKRQKVSLKKVVNNVRVLKEYDLEKYGIAYEIEIDEDLEVNAVPGLLNTAVLNLVDNAIYWLRAKKVESRTSQKLFNPKITVTVEADKNRDAILRVTDNGDGFDDPFELLIEPYYSKKTDGLGIGLYLVNEVMTRLGGKFIGYNQYGANFELIFNNNPHV
jgi:signal transduction histidine kinase